MKDKIKYYLLLLAFLFIMVLILLFFHDWIEQYSNSIMVLITFIYVVATIEICRANIKSAEATKEQLEESKRQFNETKRLEHMPYMQVSFGEWITSDKRGSYLPDMWLEINRTSDNRSASSGMSIEVTNIGLGLAVNLKCKWISAGIEQEQHLSASLLKRGECCNSTFIISAAIPEKEPQYADTSLIICFDDFLGNHYEQTVDISFQIHPHHISLVQYSTKPPKYIEG